MEKLSTRLPQELLFDVAASDRNIATSSGTRARDIRPDTVAMGPIELHAQEHLGVRVD